MMLKRILLITFAVLIVLPYLFPKYPDYRPITQTYHWGKVNIRATSHMIDRDKNIGYIFNHTTMFPYTDNSGVCEFNIINFEAKSDKDKILNQKMGVYTIENYKEGLSDTPQFAKQVTWSTGDAYMSNIKFYVQAELGKGCKAENTVIEIKEELVLKMRFHTVWNFLFNVAMSV